MDQEEGGWTGVPVVFCSPFRVSSTTRMAPNPRKAMKRKVGKNPTLSMEAPTRG